MLTYFLKDIFLSLFTVKQIRFCLHVSLVPDLGHVAEQEKATS